VGPALQCVNELMFALCTTFFLGLLLFLNWVRAGQLPGIRWLLWLMHLHCAPALFSASVRARAHTFYFLVFTYFWFILITPKCRLLLVQKH
jgi:hypothetical protein